MVLPITMVTLGLLRWTWRGLADDAFAGELPEFRPSDREAVRDMMAGRYSAVSPNWWKPAAPRRSASMLTMLDWEWLNLHSFSWLRHFRDVRDQWRAPLCSYPGARLDRARGPVRTRYLGAQRSPRSACLTGCAICRLLLDSANARAGARPSSACSGARRFQSLKVRGRHCRAIPAKRCLRRLPCSAPSYCEQGDQTDMSMRRLREAQCALLAQPIG
jgi:hypothetical protein